MDTNLQYVVQHAGGAFHNTRDIQTWLTLQRFDTLAEADAEIAELKGEMKQRCGTSAWDDHYRVIPTADTTITYRYVCLGPIVGNPRHCIEHAAARLTVFWPSGETRPYDGDSLPVGWSSGTLCSLCAERERLAIKKLGDCD